MSFEVGRSLIGYEVQKVRAAAGWFAAENASQAVPIVVAGYGEGGLVALYSSALDTRIDATLVSGYFQPREQMWKEPIYRDLWGLLREFGDAEIAGMIAPRTLVVEASRFPKVGGPPKETPARRGAAPNGSLSTPALADVRAEVERARPFFQKIGANDKLHFVASGEGDGSPVPMPRYPSWCSAAVAPLGTSHSSRRKFRRRRNDCHPPSMHPPACTGNSMNWSTIRRSAPPVSPAPRTILGKADASSPEKWKESTKFYRDYIWDEVIGRMPNQRAGQSAHPADLRSTQVPRLRSDAGRLARYLRLRDSAGPERPPARRAAAGGGLPARSRRPAPATLPIPKRLA